MEESERHKDKSELELLLEKNAYGVGLTKEEEKRAYYLISHPFFSDKECWVCPEGDKEKAIYDTGLCQSHALYALATRK
ncbi:MAG: hypothetical protein NTZ02_01890 [Candidatus Woesearchaeota archaeon]|nr:hypothetical protein [Candidatus Woesearchaeota archaeon]